MSSLPNSPRAGNSPAHDDGLLAHHCRAHGLDPEAVRADCQRREREDARRWRALGLAMDREAERAAAPPPRLDPRDLLDPHDLAAVIRSHPDIYRPLLLDLLAEGIADIALAVAREART